MNTTPETLAELKALEAKSSETVQDCMAWIDAAVEKAPALIADVEQAIADRARIAELQRENAALRQTVNDLEDSLETSDPRDLDDPFVDFPACSDEEGA